MVIWNICARIIQFLHGHTIIAGFVRDGKKSEEAEDHRQKTKDKNKKRISTLINLISLKNKKIQGNGDEAGELIYLLSYFHITFFPSMDEGRGTRDEKRITNYESRTTNRE